MVPGMRLELRCEPSGRQRTRKRREETPRDDKREAAGTHSGHGHLPLQVDCSHPQRLGWMDIVQGRLGDLLLLAPLFYKGMYNCISMLSKGPSFVVAGAAGIQSS